MLDLEIANSVGYTYTHAFRHTYTLLYDTQNIFSKKIVYNPILYLGDRVSIDKL